MKNETVHTLKPRSSIAFNGDFLWVPFHEAADSSNVAYTARVGGSDLSGNLTLAGANTNFASVPGYGLANGVDNEIDLTTTYDALLRTDTLGSGATLMLAVVKYAAYSTESGTDQVMLSYGRNGAVGGGGGYMFDIKDGATANIILAYRDVDDNSVVVSKQIAAKATVATELSVFAWIDGANNILAIGRGPIGGNAIDVVTDTLPGTVGAITNSPGMILARNNNGTIQKRLNAAGDISISLADLRVYRFVTSPGTTQLTNMVTEHSHAPFDESFLLDGLS